MQVFEPPFWAVAGPGSHLVVLWGTMKPRHSRMFPIVNWNKLHAVFRCSCTLKKNIMVLKLTTTLTATPLGGPTHSSQCGWWRRFTGDLPRSPESSAGIVTRKFRHPKFEACYCDVGKQRRDELWANSERCTPTMPYIRSQSYSMLGHGNVGVARSREVLQRSSRLWFPRLHRDSGLLRTWCLHAKGWSRVMHLRKLSRP